MWIWNQKINKKENQSKKKKVKMKERQKKKKGQYSYRGQRMKKDEEWGVIRLRKIEKRETWK